MENLLVTIILVCSSLWQTLVRALENGLTLPNLRIWLHRRPSEGYHRLSPYTHLNGGTEIRLITFESDKNGGFNCKLHVFNLINSPPFIALSYTWGDDSILHKTRLNEVDFLVRNNLWLALNTINNLRRNQKRSDQERPNTLTGDFRQWTPAQRSQFRDEPHSWKHFWIDAVCIDQYNIPERNHQVTMMGDIYSTASFVLVWLGPASPDSALALRTMTESVGFQRGSKSRKDFLVERAISKLMQRDYWKRLWIVQECILARDILFLCGSDSANWEHISRFVGQMKVLQDDNCDDVQSSLPLADERGINVIYWCHHFGSKTHLTLAPLLKCFWPQDCSDPRDKIFGLLGLVKEDGANTDRVLTVDYSLSVEELYCRVLQHLGLSRPRYADSPSLQDLRTLLEDALNFENQAGAPEGFERALVDFGKMATQQTWTKERRLTQRRLAAERSWIMEESMPEVHEYNKLAHTYTGVDKTQLLQSLNQLTGQSLA